MNDGPSKSTAHQFRITDTRAERSNEKPPEGYERCPSCGAMVEMPCIECRIQASLKSGALRRRYNT